MTLRTHVRTLIGESSTSALVTRQGAISGLVEVEMGELFVGITWKIALELALKSQRFTL